METSTRHDVAPRGTTIEAATYDVEQIESVITAYLRGVLGTTDLGPADNIFSLGLVNSMFALELVMYLEKHFELEIEDEDLEIRYFQSAREMARLVGRKRGVRAATADTA